MEKLLLFFIFFFLIHEGGTSKKEKLHSLLDEMRREKINSSQSVGSFFFQGFSVYGNSKLVNLRW